MSLSQIHLAYAAKNPIALAMYYAHKSLARGVYSSPDNTFCCLNFLT